MSLWIEDIDEKWLADISAASLSKLDATAPPKLKLFLKYGYAGPVFVKAILKELAEMPNPRPMHKSLATILKKGKKGVVIAN